MSVVHSLDTTWNMNLSLFSDNNFFRKFSRAGQGARQSWNSRSPGHGSTGHRVNDFGRVGSGHGSVSLSWSLIRFEINSCISCSIVCSKRVVYFCQANLDLHSQIMRPASFLIRYLVRLRFHYAGKSQRQCSR